LGLNTSEKRPEAPVKLAPSMKWLMSRMIGNGPGKRNSRVGWAAV
jgi:hypothetical protein